MAGGRGDHGIGAGCSPAAYATRIRDARQVDYNRRLVGTMADSCHGTAAAEMQPTLKGSIPMQLKANATLRRLFLHPILNVRLCRINDKYRLQVGRLRIEFKVVSQEWQDLCDEADARQREVAFLYNTPRDI